MKTFKYSLVGLALAAVGFTACQDKYDAPTLDTPEATMQPNTTIADFKEFLETSITDAAVDAVIVPEKEDGSHYIFRGRVISSDASGNIYQNLVLQDETAAITLSIREASMWTTYRVGQDVVFDATGLYMGSYSGLYQLGWLADYNGAPSMTFMSWFMFLGHNQMNGLPNQNFRYVSINGPWPEENPYCIITNIGELNSISATTAQGRNVMSQLVEIQNVTFEEGGQNTYAEYQESNERRYVQDAQGNRIALNNSGYATFHNDTLPEGVGNVRGILGYYQDEWQITIRGLEDVMFNQKGTQDEPYSVSEALAQENNGRTGWTRGYIVGSVKAGVSTVTSSDDIVFGGDEAETLNNVIIAETPDETDWTKCMAVNLPAGSFFRQFVNLVDNPFMYGQVLTVRGTFSSYLGMNGIVDNGGSLSEFKVDDMEFGGDYGSGTQSRPFTVQYVLDNPSVQNDVWVEGYIVGFVSGTSFGTGATFGLPGAGANYNNANVIISSSKDNANAQNSIPVRLYDRKMGLGNTPANLGKKVMFYGNIGTYLEAPGLTLTSEANFE